MLVVAVLILNLTLSRFINHHTSSDVMNLKQILWRIYFCCIPIAKLITISSWYAFFNEKRARDFGVDIW